jgi:hypothetical protein
MMKKGLAVLIPCDVGSTRAVPPIRREPSGKWRDCIMLMRNHREVFIATDHFWDGRKMTDESGSGEAVGTVEGVEFHLGSAYLIRDVDATRLYTIYNNIVENLDDGLCISRSYPHKMINQHRVTKGNFVWMTTNTVGYDRCVNPTNISMLHMAIMDFLRVTPRGIISLEGVEYLISNNGFDPILRLLHALNDKITVSDSVLLVTLDENTLPAREMRILEKDFDLAL